MSVSSAEGILEGAVGGESIAAGVEAESVSDWRSDPDTRLMLRARDGDKVAFEELFRNHNGSLYGLAYRIVGSRERAEELVQEAFLRIYHNRARYQPRARFSTYAYRVVVNLCLNELRRGKFTNLFQTLDGREDGSPGTAHRQFVEDRIHGTEDGVIGRETLERIREELQHLPAKQRTALVLSKLEGLPYDEIAEHLDTSVSAVKSMVFRALRALRQQMADVFEEDSHE